MYLRQQSPGASVFLSTERENAQQHCTFAKKNLSFLTIRYATITNGHRQLNFY